MIPKDKLNTCRRILNVAENDSGSPETEYDKIYIYRDGNGKRKQVTLARGFTQDGGNLWKVLQRYIDKGGKYADFFAGYKSKMSDGSLWQDKTFLNKLIQASREDQLMKDAQDEVFDEVYLSGAINYAEKYGFSLPLSFSVLFDSYLQSGGMLSWLVNKFPAKKPSSGGDEKEWISEYMQARNDWLSNSSSQALRNSSYRTRFFLSQIKAENWQLNCPLAMNGSEIC